MSLELGNCSECGGKFLKTQPHRLTCSRRCKGRRKHRAKVARGFYSSDRCKKAQTRQRSRRTFEPVKSSRVFYRLKKVVGDRLPLRLCVVCGASFHPRARVNVCCSTSCSKHRKDDRKRRRRNRLVRLSAAARLISMGPRICTRCSAPINLLNLRARFCSAKCRHRYAWETCDRDAYNARARELQKIKPRCRKGRKQSLRDPDKLREWTRRYWLKNRVRLLKRQSEADKKMRAAVKAALELGLLPKETKEERRALKLFLITLPNPSAWRTSQRNARVRADYRALLELGLVSK